MIYTYTVTMKMQTTFIYEKPNYKGNEAQQ